jgi:hypothetical protein
LEPLDRAHKIDFIRVHIEVFNDAGRGGDPVPLVFGPARWFSVLHRLRWPLAFATDLSLVVPVQVECRFVRCADGGSM